MKIEMEIMKEMKHPFLLHLNTCFQDQTNVYLEMPFIPGGTLFEYYRTQSRLEEQSIKFYAA